MDMKIKPLMIAVAIALGVSSTAFAQGAGSGTGAGAAAGDAAGWGGRGGRELGPGRQRRLGSNIRLDGRGCNRHGRRSRQRRHRWQHQQSHPSSGRSRPAQRRDLDRSERATAQQHAER